MSTSIIYSECLNKIFDYFFFFYFTRGTSMSVPRETVLRKEKYARHGRARSFLEEALI